ncbi:MAG: FG-GAP-like repeat-containing protein [Oligoflexia bacterium]|nr:FG-GAP-like repeat-containing protein [Oligoflexia bacterium]
MKNLAPRIVIVLIAAGATGCQQAYQVSAIQLPLCRQVVGSVEPFEARDLRWKWESAASPEYNQNMATPMVADIDGDGVSDFIFTSFTSWNYASGGILRVASGRDGRELWSTAGQDASLQPLGVAAPAVYDLDRDGKPEILVAGAGALLVFGSDGALVDRFALAEALPSTSRISVADLEFDGVYEIVIGMGATGYLYRYDFAAHRLSGMLLAGVLGMMEVDSGSPGLEVVTSKAIHGSALAKLRDLAVPGAAETLTGVTAAFGNFDSEADAEIVMTQNSPARVSVFKGSTGLRISHWEESAADREDCAARTTRSNSQIGAANVGDLDGDRRADITFAGTCWFRGLKQGGSGLEELWKLETRDFSSSVTGSSVYDFNGDGKVEVLYNDELYLRIIDGLTGQVLYRLRNDNGTLWENPVVASLRPGEPASIVVSANSYTGYAQKDDPLAMEDAQEGVANVTGIRVIQGGENLWMPTRELWNQFDYLVTNVLDDLQLPRAILEFVAVSDHTRANLPRISHPCR